MARLPASGSDVARWPPSRCQGCGCLVRVPCVHCAFSGTLRGEFKCVSNSLTAQRCGCESCATSHTTGSRDPAWPHYRWRPRTAVGPRCTLHTHTFCRHTVPSMSRPVCGCSPVSLSEQQPSLSPSQFHLSTCLQVFTCSLGSLCFFESSTHSATALGLAVSRSRLHNTH